MAGKTKPMWEQSPPWEIAVLPPMQARAGFHPARTREIKPGVNQAENVSPFNVSAAASSAADVQIRQSGLRGIHFLDSL